MPRESKTIRLNVILIKGALTSFDDLVKPAKQGEIIVGLNLKATSSVVGKFFFKDVPEKPPSWMSFVKPNLDDQNFSAANKSASAVLVLQKAGETFAVTFGHGRHLIKQDHVTRDFGLKVVLNSVDPKNLKSLDVHTFENRSLHSRKQASHGGGIEVFGIDPTKELLRSVTGVPRDASFATLVSGSDSLTIHNKIDFDQIPDKCAEALALYQSDQYKTDFPWVDNLRPVNEPAEIQRLDNLLIEKIKTDSLDGIHLTPPQAIEWADVEEFKYSIDSENGFQDFSVKHYASAISNLETFSVQKLKKHYVSVKFAGSATHHEKWKLYDCIVYEHQEADSLHVLTSGQWFRVEDTFVQKVSQFIQALPDPAIPIVSARKDEKEADYNNRLAASSANYCLMDQKLVKCDDALTQVEVCDVASKQKQLIHVKRKTHSSSLSHLFNQGLVSTQLLAGDLSFRREARAHISGWSTIEGDAVFPSERPNMSDYEIIYGIITSKQGTWDTDLPFFSQLSLMNTAQHLTRLGVKYSLIKIQDNETTTL